MIVYIGAIGVTGVTVLIPAITPDITHTTIIITTITTTMIVTMVTLQMDQLVQSSEE